MKSTEQKKRRFFDWDVSDLADDVYKKNEVLANKAYLDVILACILVNTLSVVLCSLGFFEADSQQIFYSVISIIEFFIPAIYCIRKKGRGAATKYVMLVGSALAITAGYIMFNAVVLVLMLLPLIISCRYSSPKFVKISAAVTSGMLLVGTICGVLYGTLDLNAVVLNGHSVFGTTETGTLTEAVHNAGFSTGELILMMLEQSFLPNFFFCSIVAIISILGANRGKNLANEEIEVRGKATRIESELNVATDIQANMLPRIFPAFPNHDEFDIYAEMHPAKEVGGDFYDYFMIDDSHAAFVIADVSGKGVPAALFMVTAKTLIKDHAQMGLEPAEVFTRVNRILCDGNDAGLFVTAWMATLDLSTGLVKYVNAGHNAPLVCNAGGHFEYLKSRPGFVLAGIDSVRYKQAEMYVKPGDRLFLYTDGITEATSLEKKLFGDDRLLASAEAHRDCNEKQFLCSVRADVDAFVGEAEQFDDMTMLVCTFRGRKENANKKERVFHADCDELPNVTAFVEETLEAAEVSPKTIMQINVALEEVFVNVAHYAYPRRFGDVRIALTVEDGMITLEQKDSGIPFDPLGKDDPDITLKAEERNIGGLGIFMVKKTMTDVSYRYEDGMNILTLKKEF